MDSAAWVSIATVCAAGAMSPGPSFAVVVRNTIAGGRRQGVLTGLGHGLGVGIYAATAVFGMAVFIKSNPGATRWIEGLGGAYLLFLGVQALRHAGAADLSADSVAVTRGFIDGMAISVLNPKIAVFFLALLGPLIPVDAGPSERLGVAGVAMAIDGGWYVFAAMMLATTGASEWLAKKGIWIDRLLGVVLVGLGCWLLVHQFTL
jgi:threonine/homoserine/homoserine lactone efflux protein